MKEFILGLCLICICTSNLFAQPGGRANAKIEAQKVAYITNRLDLTTEESAEFWPIYNQLQKDRKAINRKYKRKQRIENMSDAELEKQMMDILRNKFTKRSIDASALDPQQASETGINNASQKVLLKQGLDSDNGKKVVKALKGAKLKVQSQIQGEQVRVTGKKRDDLQEAIALLREQELGLPLQFTNFRD